MTLVPTLLKAIKDEFAQLKATGQINQNDLLATETDVLPPSWDDQLSRLMCWQRFRLQSPLKGSIQHRRMLLLLSHEILCFDSAFQHGLAAICPFQRPIAHMLSHLHLKRPNECVLSAMALTPFLHQLNPKALHSYELTNPLFVLQTSVADKM
ncbi:unnamed protein product [Protopolystoma xenopodis]|uniref:Uncharacterized protein n=1 Tax=Protopolystoma xenopodis TaxID=117903 RepID=A0A3S5CV02_9PLAT|nr:unnamed protein product [Protopolystoma xenopodis]